MKKWIALLLVLCMLPGLMNMAAAAAAETRTIANALFEVDVPAGGELAVEGTEPYAIYSYTWLKEGEYSLKVTINGKFKQSFPNYLKMGFADAQKFFFIDSFENMDNFADIRTGIMYIYDWNMPVQHPVIAAQAGNQYLFSHHNGYMGMAISLQAFNPDFTFDDAAAAAKPIFYSLRSPGESVPVDNQKNARKQTITFARCSFEVPADLKIVESNRDFYILQNKQYTVYVQWVDWDAEGEYSIQKSKDVQYAHFYQYFYLLTGNQETSASAAKYANPRDIRMPGGDDIMCLLEETDAAITYYYPNMGFMIIVERNVDSISDDVLLAIAANIALSFRADGMTAEETMESRDQRTANIAADKAEAAAQQFVVITNSSANIRSGPDAGTAKVKTGLKGDRFPLLGEENNWYKIDVDGKTAYVSKGLTTVE